MIIFSIDAIFVTLSLSITQLKSSSQVPEVSGYWRDSPARPLCLSRKVRTCIFKISVKYLSKYFKYLSKYMANICQNIWQWCTPAYWIYWSNIFQNILKICFKIYGNYLSKYLSKMCQIYVNIENICQQQLQSLLLKSL